MRILLTLLLFTALQSFAQSKSDTTLVFSAFEKREQQEFEQATKQIQLIVKQYQKLDSIHGIFLQKYLIANGIDLTRISNHPDSIKIDQTGIKLILKPKK